MTSFLYLSPEIRRADIGGAGFTWREAGSGGLDPMVLLHGIGSSARAWAGQFAGFAGERRVVAWNAPGYAGSSPLGEAWPGPNDYADALRRLLDHLGIARCVLVGQSLGAVVGAAFTAMDGGRVSQLIFSSPARGYDCAAEADLPETILRRIDDVRALGPAGLAEARHARLLTARASVEAAGLVRAAMSDITEAGYVEACKLLARGNLIGTICKAGLSVDVICGAEDVVTPPSTCREVAEAAGGAYVELPGLGHAAASEGPAAFNAALRSLIARRPAK